MSNVYGTLLLIVLLSYGLIFLPFAIWKSASNQRVVLDNLVQADQAYEMCKEARLDFMREVNICRALAENHRTGFNQQYFEALVKELPTEDLDGQTIYASKLMAMNVVSKKMLFVLFQAWMFEISLKIYHFVMLKQYKW